MKSESNFKKDLLAYNKLFDEYQKLNFSFGKKYAEASHPIIERAAAVINESSNSIENINEVIACLNLLADITKNQAYKDFCNNSSDNTNIFAPSELNRTSDNGFFTRATFQSVDLYNNKFKCLRDLDSGAEVVKAINMKYPISEGEVLIKAYKKYRENLSSYHRTFFLFRGTGLRLYLVCGFITLIALLSLTYWNFWTIIVASILIILFGGSLIARIIFDLIFSKKRAVHYKNIEDDFYSCTDKYITSIIRILIKEKDESYNKFIKDINEYDSKLKEIGDKFESNLEIAAKDIKSKMNSYDVINKAINNLIVSYGEQIKYSKDYMDLFEKSVYLNLDTENDFLSAVRALIDIKNKEIREKEAQEMHQKEVEEQRNEDRMRWEYQANIQREALKEQQRQTEIAKIQHDEQKKAASSICFTCKNKSGCALRRNLSSPTCSRYQMKY